MKKKSKCFYCGMKADREVKKNEVRLSRLVPTCKFCRKDMDERVISQRVVDGEQY